MSAFKVKVDSCLRQGSYRFLSDSVLVSQKDYDLHKNNLSGYFGCLENALNYYHSVMNANKKLHKKVSPAAIKSQAIKQFVKFKPDVVFLNDHRLVDDLVIDDIYKP